MKKLSATLLAALFAAALCPAAPTDDVAAAAKKLTAAPNYAWSRTTEMAGGGGGGFGAGKIDGVAEKGGYTVTTREGPNGTFQTIRKGEQFVMQNQEGAWVTREELMQQFGGGAGAGAGRGGRGGGMFGAGQQDPAEEIAALAPKIKDAKIVDGAIVGTLAPEDVAPLLAFGGRGGGQGQTPPAPTN
ncbi:MAG: hypothetical protein ABIZ49_09360, partial [Opitutaceae bacterium]